MQGQRSSISTMAENVSFDHGSSSSDMGTDPQLTWNSMRTSAQNRLPDYRLPSNETNTHVTRDAWNAEWSLGESSAPQHQHDQHESKVEHMWTFDSHAALSLEEQQNQSSNILALENTGVNLNGNSRANGSFHLHGSSYALNQDLNVASGFGDQEDGSHQGVERQGTYISVGSSSEMHAIGGASSSFGSASRRGGHMLDNGEDRIGSLDGRRMPCKRKAIELDVGQSSGAGSSNCFQNSERSHWNNIHTAQIPVGSINIPMPLENNLVTSNGSDPENSRLQLGVGGAVSASPFSLTAPSGNATSSHRNCRLRIGLQQEDPIFGNRFSPEADVGNVGGSSHHSRSGLGNGYFDLNPSPAAENGNLGGQSIPFVPNVRQNHQSQWAGPSSTGASSSSSSAIPEEWSAVPYEEPTIRNIPRSIAEHPMFVTASEMGNSSQNHPLNWNSVGANNHVAGNFAPLPRVGPSTAATFSASSSSHRNSRRLSELVRRSLLSSAGTESGSQSSNPDIRSRSFAPYHEMALPHRSDNHRHRAPGSRPLLDRHGAFAIPYSPRTLAAAGEGRSSVMSEIRHVLDLMRRGEGLRLEDVMILDHSVFAGMADIHDRHRDMRLDVDNMSYEELLALEERIGNVCTGLSEETIISHMKQHKYVDIKAGQAETEPCSICREEYNAGEEVGALECGHEFHQNCIKQWLLLKNLCPICKTTGLAT